MTTIMIELAINYSLFRDSQTFYFDILCYEPVKSQETSFYSAESVEELGLNSSKLNYLIKSLSNHVSLSSTSL